MARAPRGLGGSPPAGGANPVLKHKPTQVVAPSSERVVAKSQCHMGLKATTQPTAQQHNSCPRSV